MRVHEAPAPAEDRMSELWTIMVREVSGKETQLVYLSKGSAEIDFNQLGDYAEGNLRLKTREGLLLDPVATKVSATFTDSYGCAIRIKPELIACVILRDVHRVAEGEIEIAVFQARSQAKAQERAAADPVLKARSDKQAAEMRRQQATSQFMPVPGGFIRGG